MPHELLARHIRLSLASVALLVALALGACAPGGGSAGGASPTATASALPPATPSPTSDVVTTCAQVWGFGSALSLSLPHLQFPKGTVALAPQTAAGGPGQYAVTTYAACAPNTDFNLTVQTGKGDEPFLKLAEFYGWAVWDYFPTNGDIQEPCPGSCVAYNTEDPGAGLFQAAPTFLALSDVREIGPGGVVTFNLLVTTPPTPGDCAYMQSGPGGPAPVAIWYDQKANIQYPPLTQALPDNTTSTTGAVACSSGSLASVKAFMDKQFTRAGYTSDPCQAYDCWEKSGVVVSLQLSSANQWFIFTPRAIPTVTQ